MGRPGVDFPVLPSIPSTSFSCRSVRKPGYYADLDTDCQVFHICDGGRKISFLCPNGTIFRQSHLICDWWFRVDCGKSVELYEESAEQLAADQRVYRERAEAINRAMHKDSNQGGSEPDDSQRRPKNQPPASSGANAHINGPVFAAAKQNYESRQKARKQSPSQQKKQTTTQPENGFQSDKGVNQLNALNYDGLNSGDEREHQILSETASFASSRGNRFGKQFYQGTFNSITPSSEPSQSFSVSPSTTTSNESPKVNFFTQTSTTNSHENKLYDSSSQTHPSPSISSSELRLTTSADSFESRRNLASSTVLPNDLTQSSFFTQSTTATPIEDTFKSSTQTQSHSFENAYVSSVSTSANLFQLNTSSTPIPKQKNFRAYNRFPTSSQNSNFRFSQPRSKLANNEKNYKPLTDSQETPSPASPSSSQTESSYVSSTVTPFLDVSQSSFIDSLSSANPPQKSFYRPSPDLRPPHAGIESDSNSYNGNKNQRVKATATINSRNLSQGNRNKNPNSSTKRPLLTSSTNRFTSSTSPSFAQPSVDRKQKSRRLPSTTEKPVFTVKFRPSKSFSYVELERTRTSESSTTPALNQIVNSQSQFTSAPTETNQLYSSTQDPVSSFSYSGEAFAGKKQFNTFSDNGPSFDQHEVASSPSSKEYYSQTEWTPTRSPIDNSHSKDSQTENSRESPFSTTSSEHFSSYSTISTSYSDKSTTLKSLKDQDILLDKLADFSNIDPAEINLLPSGGKVASKSKLRVPESSGPNALHTLALYYATSESDIGTTPAYSPDKYFSRQPVEITDNFTEIRPVEKTNDGNYLQQVRFQETKVSDEILQKSHSGSPDSEPEVENSQSVDSSDALKDLSSVLTKATKDSFSSLFNQTNTIHAHTEDQPCSGDDIYDLDMAKAIESGKYVDLKNDSKNDLESEQSRGIVQPKQTVKNNIPQFSAAFDDLPDELKLKDSTNLRELAQVFSRALSAYLEDPDNFRRILSEVRPTEPTNGNSDGTTQPLDENDGEVLDFSDASNTGTQHANGHTTASNQKDSINSLDIEQINDLASALNYTEGVATNDLTPDYTGHTVSQFYTTVNPSSFAADINLLSNGINQNNSAEVLLEDAYLPTAGGVDDQSRPRYGGFHNNSASFNHKPYGSDVLNTVTGKPLTEATYVTDVSVLTTFDHSEGEIFANTNYSTSASNQIDIESIPEQLGIVPPSDINSLVDSHNNFNDPSQIHGGHFITEVPSESLHKNALVETEDEIYSTGNDQEKLLIASGSQSLVSRDNYVRFFTKTHDETSANPTKHKTHVLDKNGPQSESISETKASTPSSIRGTVKFGPALEDEKTDVSNFRRRANKEITFQNVNLGNGITLERTKTVRFSTPELKSFTNPPIPVKEVYMNPASINSQLGFISDDVVASPENIRGTQDLDSAFKATTYHPSSSLDPELPDVIPPRGSLRNSWTWSSRVSSSAETPTNFIENHPTNFPTELNSQSFSSFTSTLLPPNVTFETAGEEMLEKKAEEIFGKLNETSAEKLMNVMNQAESNMTVRRLVLLLVSDRNGRENRSYEDSRAQLIQALLKTSESPANPTPSLEDATRRSSEKKPYSKQNRSRSRSRSSTTEAITSPTVQTSTASRGRRPKAYRGTAEANKSSDKSTLQSSPKTVDSQYLRSPNLFAQNPSVKSFGADPDARAVELLKSLYNLAARWG